MGEKTKQTLSSAPPQGHGAACYSDTSVTEVHRSLGPKRTSSGPLLTPTLEASRCRLRYQHVVHLPAQAGTDLWQRPKPQISGYTPSTGGDTEPGLMGNTITTPNLDGRFQLQNKPDASFRNFSPPWPSS